MLYHNTWGQRVVQLLQCIASLPGAVASATPTIHCHTAWGRWAAELLQYAGPLSGETGNRTQEAVTAESADLLQCTASLPRGTGQWNSCHALPHRLGAVGSGTPTMHCLTAWGQWAVQLLQYIASLPGGKGQWNSCNALPHCMGAVGSGTLAMHGPTSWGDGECSHEAVAVQKPSAVGNGTHVMHCLTARG